MHASTSTSTSRRSRRSMRTTARAHPSTCTQTSTRTTTAAATALIVLACISQTAAQMSVYVPGQIDDIPGNSPVAQGAAGVDGYTTYMIGGAILQENSASAIMTNYGPNGVPIVYNCVMGADAQATCSVVQGDGVNYAYTEPITYFGQTTGQLPAAFASPTAATTTPTAAAAGSTGTPLAGVGANAAASSVATSAPSPSSASNKGPLRDQAQSTGANAFGAGDLNGGAASVSHALVMWTAAVAAGFAGAALVLA